MRRLLHPSVFGFFIRVMEDVGNLCIGKMLGDSARFPFRLTPLAPLATGLSLVRMKTVMADGMSGYLSLDFLKIFFDK